MRQKLIPAMIAVAISFFAVSAPCRIAHSAEAKSSNPSEAERGYFDEMILAFWRMMALNTDITLYVAWKTDDKASLGKSLPGALSELAAIREHISRLKEPKGLSDMKAKELLFADALTKAFTVIEKKTDEELAYDYGRVNQVNSELSDIVQKAFARYRDPGSGGWDLNVLEIEKASIKDDTKRDTYKAALDLIKQKNFDRAFSILNGMALRMQGDPFVSCIYLRMADCSLIKNAGADPLKGDLSDGLFYINKAIQADRYNPALFESFMKWRTVTQAKKHGMQADAPIPNVSYNSTRQKLVDAVKNYLKDHPEDLWARVQLARFLMLPNIERDGPGGNNTNAVYWQELFASNT